MGEDRSVASQLAAGVAAAVDTAGVVASLATNGTGIVPDAYVTEPISDYSNQQMVETPAWAQNDEALADAYSVVAEEGAESAMIDAFGLAEDLSEPESSFFADAALGIDAEPDAGAFDLDLGADAGIDPGFEGGADMGGMDSGGMF